MPAAGEPQESLDGPVAAIYHITTAAEARAATSSGEYAPTAFEEDGFIHCSHVHQVTEVANYMFGGEKDLVLLEIDRTKVTARVVDENLSGGDELFPHIYGRLAMSAVTRVHRFPCREDGTFDLPSSVSV